ncbi:MAG: hypothetical protein U0802_03415 [Candidatus Binatia bacterium]
MKRMASIARWVLATVVCVLAFVAPASADSTTERSSSILIFPKVVYDGSRDTVIQISNTSNSMVHAHCFYVDATPICIGSGDCLAGTCSGTCEPQWQEVDFNIWLTKQQPTHWTASVGRFTNPADEPCDRNTGNYDCDDAGLDPGRVPPVASFPFQGELRCIEVDQSGAPISGNHLKGEGTIVSANGDATKYNAVGLLGEPFTNNGDNVLCLGGGVSDECPSGAEYQGCGQRVVLNHFAGGADDPILGPTSSVATEVTLVPCRADYERQEATRIVVQFVAFNEYEQRFSANTTVDCWRSFFLTDVSNIFGALTAQTRFVETQMRSSAAAISGFVGVVEEYHTLDGETARVAFNLHEQGTREKTDLIYIPEGP